MVEFAGIEALDGDVRRAPDGHLFWASPMPLAQGRAAVWTIIPPQGEDHACSLLLVHRQIDENEPTGLRAAKNNEGAGVDIYPLKHGDRIAQMMLEFGADHPGDIRTDAQAAAPKMTVRNNYTSTIKMDVSDGLSVVDELTCPIHIRRELAMLAQRATDPAWKELANVLDPHGALRQSKDIGTVDPLRLDKFQTTQESVFSNHDAYQAEGARRDHRFTPTDKLHQDIDEMTMSMLLGGVGLEHLRLPERAEAIAHGADPVGERGRLDWAWKKEIRDAHSPRPGYVSPVQSFVFADPPSNASASYMTRLMAPDSGILDTLVARRTDPDVHRPFLAIREGLTPRLEKLLEYPGTATSARPGFMGLSRGFSVKAMTDSIGKAKAPKDLPYFVLPDKKVSTGKLLIDKLAHLHKVRPKVVNQLYMETLTMQRRLAMAHDLSGNELFRRDAEGFGRGVATLERVVPEHTRKSVLDMVQARESAAGLLQDVAPVTRQKSDIMR